MPTCPNLAFISSPRRGPSWLAAQAVPSAVFPGRRGGLNTSCFLPMIVNPSSDSDMSTVGSYNTLSALITDLWNQKQPYLGAPPQDSPPSYDFATESGSTCKSNQFTMPFFHIFFTDSPDTVPKPLIPSSPKADSRQPLIPQGMASGPSYTVQPSYTAPPTVYNYINPLTGERVVSLLPPSHPEMICLQSGEHIPHTHYGLLGESVGCILTSRSQTNAWPQGVLAAIFWFPLGIGLCLLDKRVTCKRCGLIIENGICSWERGWYIPSPSLPYFHYFFINYLTVPL